MFDQLTFSSCLHIIVKLWKIGVFIHTALILNIEVVEDKFLCLSTTAVHLWWILLHQFYAIILKFLDLHINIFFDKNLRKIELNQYHLVSTTQNGKKQPSIHEYYPKMKKTYSTYNLSSIWWFVYGHVNTLSMQFWFYKHQQNISLWWVICSWK